MRQWYVIVFNGLLFLGTITPMLGQEDNFQKEVNEDDLGEVSDKFDALFFEALKLKSTQNHDKAIYRLNDALKINDKKGYIYFELAKNHDKVEHYEEADTNYKKALELAPHRKEILEFMYRFYYRYNKFENALWVINKLVKENPKYENAKVDVLFQSKQYDEALLLLDAIEDKYGKSSERSWKRQLISAATAKDVKKDWKKNIQRLRKNILNDPKDEQSYLQLIIYYYEKGEPQKAYTVAKKLEKEIPDSKIVHYALYKQYLEQGNSDAAIESIMIVLKEDEIGKEFKHNMINDLLLYVKKNPRVQTKLTELVERFANDEDNDKIYMILSDFKLQKGSKEDNLTYYNSISENVSQDFELLKSKILIQMDFNKFDKVTLLSQEGIEKYPAQPILYLFNGIANNKQGNARAALGSLNTGVDYIIDDSKMEADFYKEMAIAYRKLGLTSKAASYEKKAEQLQSKLKYFMGSKTRILMFLMASIILLSSCKTTKVVSDNSKATNLNVKKIIANHYENSFRFTSLKGRIKAQYDDGSKTANLTASLRMEKDKNIWLSVKFGGFIVVAKALITPSKVQYYEVVNNTYFDGDFALLSKWLGTELDFEKVQNLLLGQALFDLKKEKYTSIVETPYYKLTPKKESALFERLFLIRADNFKVQNQKIFQSSKNRTLQVEYSDYQKIANQYFPEILNISASKPGKESTIAMQYKDIQYNAKVSFPFSIPSGAKRITIK